MIVDGQWHHLALSYDSQQAGENFRIFVDGEQVAATSASGLGVDPLSGVISGTPSAAGISTVSLSATDSQGTSSLNLTLNIRSEETTLVDVVAAECTNNANGTETVVIPLKAGTTGTTAGWFARERFVRVPPTSP